MCCSMPWAGRRWEGKRQPRDFPNHCCRRYVQQQADGTPGCPAGLCGCMLSSCSCLCIPNEMICAPRKLQGQKRCRLQVYGRGLPCLRVEVQTFLCLRSKGDNGEEVKSIKLQGEKTHIQALSPPVDPQGITVTMHRFEIMVQPVGI